MGNNIDSNYFLEFFIAGVKLTSRIKDVTKCEGNRRVKRNKASCTRLIMHTHLQRLKELIESMTLH